MDTNIGLGWVGIAWMWCVNARACVAFFFKLPIVALLVIPRDERLSTVFFFFPTAVLRNDKRRDKC